MVAADIDELHESLLSGKYNFGAPRVSVAEVRNDGTLVLQHDSQLDGRGLDAERAAKVLEYIKRVWRRPVLLNTVDSNAKAVVLSSESRTELTAYSRQTTSFAECARQLMGIT